MTSQFTTPATVPPVSAARPGNFGPGNLTAGDAERIAAAIDAELADSTSTCYASAWRQWELRPAPLGTARVFSKTTSE